MRPSPRRAVFFTTHGFRPVNRVERYYEAVHPARTSMPLAVWQDEENLYVEADLPGVRESDLAVTVHQGTLTIRGERKPAEGRTSILETRTFGPFEQTLALPEEIRQDEVQAALTGGVLRITLPKRPESKPQRITVQAD